MAHFALSAIVHSGNELRAILSRCRNGEFGDEVRRETARHVEPDAFTNAMKQYAYGFVFLTLTDQGWDTSPAWFYEFLRSATVAIDSFLAGRPVGEIMEMYAGAVGYDVCGECARGICDDLGLPAISAQLIPTLSAVLANSKDRREYFVKASLLQPMPVIMQQIQGLMRGQFAV